VDARFLGREEDGEDTDVAREGAGDGPSNPRRSMDATGKERHKQDEWTATKAPHTTVFVDMDRWTYAL
jgi:hypothetical protein